jgi:hypothetical protein
LLERKRLAGAVERAEKGQVDADLGGGVIKQDSHGLGRGSRVGTERSSFFRRGERAVFAYGFSKSVRANIDADEVKQFKDAARHVLRLTGKQMDELIENGDFVEVKYEQEISE